MIDKLEKRKIEFKESCHYLEVYIEGKFLVEVIRCYPSDVLTHDFHLVVDTLDREECFLEALRDGTVEHEFLDESLTSRDVFLLDFKSLMLREVGKQTY